MTAEELLRDALTTSQIYRLISEASLKLGEAGLSTMSSRAVLLPFEKLPLAQGNGMTVQNSICFGTE